MQVSFRQGIINYPISGLIQQFLQIAGNYVNLNAANGPTSIAFAHKNTDYLLVESVTVSNAWGPFTVAQNYWLYWDINLRTGLRTFGFTTIAPVYQLTEPSLPAVNQHWFDLNTFTMKVWDGTFWREVVRVFAARYDTATFISMGAGLPNLPFAGTQVALNVPITLGSIIYDDNNLPLQRTNGELLTTTNHIFVNGAHTNVLTLEQSIMTVTAAQSISAYSVVKLSNFGQVSPAVYEDTSETILAIVNEGATTNSATNAIMQGIVVNPGWSWSTPGAPLWVSTNGILVDIDPNISDSVTHPLKKVPIARVLTPTSIFFQQGLGSKGDQGPPGTTSFFDASTSTKGIVKLSVSPVLSTNPIAVGDNDPRMTDARIPLPHTQTASTITLTPYGTITASNVQTGIQQIEDNKLAKSGGIMTGFLTLNSDPVNNLHAATKQYVINYVTTSNAGAVAEINNIETSIGSILDFDGTWLGFTGTFFLNGATSVKNAFQLLDTRLNFDKTVQVDMLSSGLISGGVITVGGGNIVNIAAGIGYTNTGTDFKKISWGSTSVATIADGLNHIQIDTNGNPQCTTGSHPASAIHLGHAYVTGGNTAIIEVFPNAEFIDNFVQRVHNEARESIGPRVISGCEVTEQLSPNFLKLNITAGTITQSLNYYDVLASTSFRKLYFSSDLGWVEDLTNPNMVDVTHWNDITQPAVSALVLLSPGWWKKCILVRITNGDIFYIYSQHQYRTFDEASAAPIPFFEPEILEDVVVLAEFVVQQGMTTIANQIRDIRPQLKRVFGYGTDPATGENNAYALARHTHGIGGYSNSSTGLYEGGQVTINGIDNSKFDVSAGTALFVDNTTDPLNPSFKLVSWNAFTSVAIINLLTQLGTAIGIDQTGSIIQSASPFTYEQLRTTVPLAYLFHGTHDIIRAVRDFSATGFDPAERLNDLMESVGIINIQGNLYSANGANLMLNKTSGKSHAFGANFHTNPQSPDVTNDPPITAAAWQYSYRNGSGSFIVVPGATTINTNQYDNGTGTLVSIPAGQWVSIPLFYVPGLGTSGTRIQYPQKTFATQGDAIAGGAPDLSFIANPNLTATGSIRGYLIVQQGATDLSNPAVAQFIPGGKFSGVIGGGTLGSGAGGGAPTDAQYILAVADAPLTNAKVIGTDFFITNTHVGASAGIVESKLALNYPTHSNANDPTSGQHDALVGTSGIPGSGNRYVTDSDPRNTNARTPTSHLIIDNTGVGSQHTIAGGVSGYVFKATGATTAQLMQLSHGELTASSIGTNTHAQIDSHIASTNNPHQTSIANLIDTNIVIPAAGHVLYYSTGDNKWHNAAPGSTSGVQAWGTELDALSALATTGIIVRTGSGTAATRTLTAGSSKISITNGDGVASNPTIDINQSNLTIATSQLTGTLPVGNGGTGTTTTPTNGQLLIGNGTNYTVASVGTTTGISITVGAGTLTINNTGVTSIAGTANQITMSASTGSVTAAIASNPIIPGTADITIPTGTTAQRPGIPTNGMIRYNSDENILEGYTTPYSLSTLPNAFQRTRIYRKRREWVDEFLVGQSGTANAVAAYGELLWTQTSTGGGATATSITPTTDHPGVYQFTTGGANGNSTRFHLGVTAASNIIMANQIGYMAWLIQLSANTSVTVRIGTGQDISAANNGTDGVFFTFDPSVHANWQFITRSASTSTTVTTTQAVAATTWYLLEAFYDGTTWTPVINGTTYTGSTTNIPTVAVNVGSHINTNTGASRSIQVDYFSMITRELGQRY